MFKIFAKNSGSTFSDITDYISRDSIQITENLQEKTNQLAFRMESNPVSQGQEVKVYDVSTLTDTSSVVLLTVNNLYDRVKKYRTGDKIWLDINGANEESVIVQAVDTFSKKITITTASNTHSIGSLIGKKKFAGHVSNVSDKNLHQLKNLEYSVNCFDYTKEFDRKNINDSYVNKSAKEITDEFVREVVNVGLTEGFTTSDMMTGSDFSKVRAAFKKPMELMQGLADADNFVWWIDYDKRIQYKAFQEDLAPFGLTSTSNNFIDLSITADLTKVKNRQIVVGGFEDASSFTTEFHQGDEVKREWVLRSKFSDLSVFVGTNSSSMTTASVLPDFINEAGSADYFSNYQGQSVRADDATPTLGTTSLIRFTYREKIPINVLDEDPASIASLKALGFGDGVMEGRPIVDSSVDSRTEAENLARAELLKHANPIISARFSTDMQGLKPGQSINIKDDSRNIDQDFLIQSTREKVYAGDNSKFDIVCASSLYGITELIQQLLRSGERIELDENIGIDLIKLLRENVNLTSSWVRESENLILETVSMTASWSERKIEPPFVYGLENKYSVALASASSQYLTIADGDQTGLDITGDITIEVWIKLTALPSTGGIAYTIANKWIASAGRRSYMLRINEFDILTFIYSADGSSTGITFLASDAAIVDASDVGEWVHIAVAVDVSAQTAYMYKNGVLVASSLTGGTATAIYDGTADFRLGSYGNTTLLFNGQMDEVRVWTGIRSSASISEYKDRGLISATTSLVACWKMENNYTDLSGNGNTLTPVNSPTFSTNTPYTDEITYTKIGKWNLSQWS
jgi:hypothetical protein